MRMSLSVCLVTIRFGKALMLALMLAGCGPDDTGNTGTNSNETLKEWPAHRQGMDPPLAPPEIEAVIQSVDLLAAQLPFNALVSLVDPIALGATLRDITDPEQLAFFVRATLAQAQSGGRVPYHNYGMPQYNKAVELIPVEFHNRYGTRLYGEIVLPYRATRSPEKGPFPVIIALEGSATNTSVYRWWHQAFADAGYLVFAFDFSGQGLSDDEGVGDPNNNIEEAQDALTYLFEQSPVRSVLDKGRVGVIGHSMGAGAALGLQEVEPRVHAVVAGDPVAEPFFPKPYNVSKVPVMIQTGDNDGPVLPIPFVNPAVVRPVYDGLTKDRAYIVAEAATHAQHTSYPLFPTASWGLEIAGRYSLAWMDWYLRGDLAALKVLYQPHPHLSYLWDSEIRINGETTVYRGSGLALPSNP